MNYWERRQAEDAYEAFEDAEKTAKVIAKYYAGASSFLVRKAERVFEKFRQKHHLTEAEAKALLARVRDKKSASELLERLRASQNKQEKAELLSEIEAPAYRARLMRLAELQDNTDRVMEALYTKENDTSTEFYKKLAEESYLKEIYRTQQRANAAFSFGSVDKKTVDRALRSKWSGKNYSERIWDNTQELADTLKDEMILSFLTGKGERDMARTIQERFRVGANAARRLVRTESNHIRTEMDFEAYKEAGVEEYQYLATLDLRTSKICRSLDGKIFKVSDRKVGVNCPPMHPWCRSTTISVIDRDLLDTMQRAAIDPATGERIMVPRTMTYEEWWRTFVVRSVNTKRKKEPAKHFVEITDSWCKDTNYVSSGATDVTVYPVNGKMLPVDGNDIQLKYGQHEKAVGDMIATSRNVKVEMCPRVNKPEGVHAPDYLINGKRFDLKTISKTGGENAIYNRICGSVQKGQADNFIIDITEYAFDDKALEKQIEKVFWSRHTRDVKVVIVVKNMRIIRIVERQ